MATQTQTTTGGATPGYGLDSNIMAAVGKAGPSGSKARGILDESSVKGDGLKAGADTVAKGAKQIKEASQAKRNAKIAAAEEWDASFDKMNETGAWANENLFSKFEETEAAAREKYIQAVRDGDKGEMAKLSKSQSSRSNSLQGWKGTMEAAQAIHTGVGWSKAFLGDDEEAVANRALMTALAKMESGEGGMADNMQFVDGEMVFVVDGKTWTRREIDDLAAKGTKPIAFEMAYMQELEQAQKNGAEGKKFNYKRELNQARMSITDDNMITMMTEDLGGGGSFSEHIKSHEHFKKAFAEGGFANGSVTGSAGTILEDPTPDTDMTPEDWDTFSDEDMNLIIKEMGKDKSVATEYLAEYKTLQLQSANELGADDEASELSARRKTVDNMTEAELADFKKNPPPEFARADGTLDLYKFLFDLGQ
jgi:hypothetical protein